MIIYPQFSDQRSSGLWPKKMSLWLIVFLTWQAGWHSPADNKTFTKKNTNNCITWSTVTATHMYVLRGGGRRKGGGAEGHTTFGGNDRQNNKWDDQPAS